MIRKKQQQQSDNCKRSKQERTGALDNTARASNQGTAQAKSANNKANHTAMSQNSLMKLLQLNSNKFGFTFFRIHALIRNIGSVSTFKST